MRVENLSLKSGDFCLQSLSFEIPHGKTAVLLGHSGAGKSLLLEALAGFIPLISGKIFISKRDITALAPEKRHVGFMFQDYALFPNYDVEHNILFSDRFKKKTGKKFSLQQVLDLLHISHLKKRDIASLSGGERQRVALARVIYSEPEIFLFDEPMAALDGTLKKELCLEFRNILHEMNCTTIYVTHDPLEASILGDTILFIENGKLIQQGTWEELHKKPASSFVAKSMGFENILQGKILKDQQEEACLVDLFDCNKTLSIKTPSANFGKVVQIGIEDAAIRFSSGEKNIGNAYENSMVMTVEDVIPWGNYLFRVSLMGDLCLHKYVSKHTIEMFSIEKGKQIKITIDKELIRVWQQI